MPAFETPDYQARLSPGGTSLVHSPFRRHPGPGLAPAFSPIEPRRIERDLIWVDNMAYLPEDGDTDDETISPSAATSPVTSPCRRQAVTRQLLEVDAIEGHLKDIIGFLNGRFECEDAQRFYVVQSTNWLIEGLEGMAETLKDLIKPIASDDEFRELSERFANTNLDQHLVYTMSDSEDDKENDDVSI